MRLQESRNASLSKTSVAILLGLVKADSQSEDNGAFLSDRFRTIRQVIIMNIGVFETIASAIRRLYVALMVYCKQ